MKPIELREEIDVELESMEMIVVTGVENVKSVFEQIKSNISAYLRSIDV